MSLNYPTFNPSTSNLRRIHATEYNVAESANALKQAGYATRRGPLPPLPAHLAPSHFPREVRFLATRHRYERRSQAAQEPDFRMGLLNSLMLLFCSAQPHRPTSPDISCDGAGDGSFFGKAISYATLRAMLSAKILTVSRPGPHFDMLSRNGILGGGRELFPPESSSTIVAPPSITSPRAGSSDPRRRQTSRAPPAAPRVPA